MYNITIGIPTYQRPLMLEKLLISILKNNVNKSLIKELNLIVIDNDTNKSAERIVNNIMNTNALGSFKLYYYNFPIKGLSNVRNELFKKALKFNPDYILCVDDDEYVSHYWLNHLVTSITTNKGDIVMGPVKPSFEPNISPCISYLFRFKYHQFINNQKLDFFESCNFIIRADFLLRHDIKFDNRFNSTGSEDSYFGVVALKKGAKLFWAENAVVYETIPSKRASLKWLMKRSYNGANNFTYLLKLKKDYLGLLKKFIISAVYFLSGFLALIVIPFPFKWKYWGLLKISESIGGFAGLSGLRYNEYAKDKS